MRAVLALPRSLLLVSTNVLRGEGGGGTEAERVLNSGTNSVTKAPSGAFSPPQPLHGLLPNFPLVFTAPCPAYFPGAAKGAYDLYVLDGCRGSTGAAGL